MYRCRHADTNSDQQGTLWVIHGLLQQVRFTKCDLADAIYDEREWDGSYCFIVI